MKVALDTSAIVVGLWRGHPDHARARPWVLPGEAERTACAHALAEAWSVLTRLPLRPRISAAAAEAMIAQLAGTLEVVPVTEDVQRAAIRRCAARGLVGGAVHDALHLVAAEVAGVEAIVTFDARHFERLRDPGSPRVLVPRSEG